MTSTSPSAARPRTCSRRRTPAACMPSPPIPTRSNEVPVATSSRATPAAWRSPDVSPATIRISGTRGRGPLGEDRQRPLDLADDPERDGERFPPVLAGHHYRPLARDGGDEALELETQRLAFWRLERNALHEVVDRSRRLAQRGKIEVGAKPVELAGPGPEIERQIPARLEHPQLARPVTRDTARGDVRHGTGVERQARVRNIDERRQHGHADRLERRDVTANERSHQIDVVNHQVEDDSDVRAAGVEGRETIALDESRRTDVRQRRPDRPVEPLDVPGLYDHAGASCELEQLVRLLEADGDRLLDQHVFPPLEGRLGDRVVRRRRHDNGYRVCRVEQLGQRRGCRNAELRGHHGGTLRRVLVEPDQLRAGHVPQDADVMVAERPGPDDAHQRRTPQMTTPRFVSLTKRTNSCTSASGWSSASARCKACDRLSSDR